MLTPAWTTLRTSEVQSQLWRTPARFVAVAAGRASGKSEIARRYLVRHLPIQRDWNTQYVYALPALAQARRVWQTLVDYVPPHWIVEIDHRRLFLRTCYGSTLRAVATDLTSFGEGEQLDGIVLDNAASHRAGVLSRAITSTVHRGFCWIVGVPDRNGPSNKVFRSLCDDWSKSDSACAAYHWPSSDVLSAEQLAEARRFLSEQDFDEQFNAVWN